jgi:bacterioferritin-associated ferredoxin
VYVCQCRAVTDRQVRGAVAEGCSTLRSVAALTGAGTGCGACVPTIRDLVCGNCPSLRTALPCDDGVDLLVVDPAPAAAPLAAQPVQ